MSFYYRLPVVEIIISSRVSAPLWNIDLTPLHLAPLKKKEKNLKLSDPSLLSTPSEYSRPKNK